MFRGAASKVMWRKRRAMVLAAGLAAAIVATLSVLAMSIGVETPKAEAVTSIPPDDASTRWELRITDNYSPTFESAEMVSQGKLDVVKKTVETASGYTVVKKQQGPIDVPNIVLIRTATSNRLLALWHEGYLRGRSEPRNLTLTMFRTDSDTVVAVFELTNAWPRDYRIMADGDEQIELVVERAERVEPPRK